MKRLAVAMTLVLVSTIALAHMKSRPDLTDWLRSLYSQDRGPCCDNTEAETMADPDWRYASEFPDSKGTKCLDSEMLKAEGPTARTAEFCIRLEAPATHEWNWWTVPKAAVVMQPNRAGPALVWMSWVSEGGTLVGPRVRPYIRCFLPGTGI